MAVTSLTTRGPGRIHATCSCCPVTHCAFKPAHVSNRHFRSRALQQLPRLKRYGGSQRSRQPTVARSAGTDLVRICLLERPKGFAYVSIRDLLLQSAGLLEAVATAALQSRLRRYNKVETLIDCNLLGLLRGAVQHVEIRGTGWESRAGLTARVLEVQPPIRLPMHTHIVMH